MQNNFVRIICHTPIVLRVVFLIFFATDLFFDLVHQQEQILVCLFSYVIRKSILIWYQTYGAFFGGGVELLTAALPCYAQIMK